MSETNYKGIVEALKAGCVLVDENSIVGLKPVNPKWQLYAGADDTFLGEYESEAQAKRAARYIYDNHSKLIEPRFRWNIYHNNHFFSSLINMTEEEKLMNPRAENKE